MTNFIGGIWSQGAGNGFESENPATGDVIWKGQAATAADIDGAVKSAHGAFPAWAGKSFEERQAVVEKFRALLEQNKAMLAETIARDTGKALWDSAGEVTAMIGKVAISIKAYHERTGFLQSENAGITSTVRHKPHGVLAVFGPYNFPGHLPNGHIVPALLAGNTVIFKPSEQTPLVAEATVKLWEQAGMPAGVMNLVQGERDTGKALAAHAGINGLLFTGSSETGQILLKQFADRPEKILALEMGGNNPLIVWDVADFKAAAFITIQSAFMTTGQRCSCARRLIIPAGKAGDAFLDVLCAMTDGLTVGAYNATPEPFMGPLISNAEVEKILAAQDNLKNKGGKILRELKRAHASRPFLTPGIMNVSGLNDRPDKEVFGPFLQVIRVGSYEAALEEANNTRYGLTAGVLTDTPALWEQFVKTVRAGVINWNRPITGASSAAPYGGVGVSGNHHASAYYAADYCAYPVASMLSKKLELPAALPPGMKL